MDEKEVKLINAIRVGRGIFIILNKDGYAEIANNVLSGYWVKGRTPNSRFNDFPLLVSLEFEDNSERIEVGMGMSDYVHFEVINHSEYKTNLENQLKILNQNFK